MGPDTNLGIDNPQEREKLLREIRALSAQLRRFGVNLRNLKETARAMTIAYRDGEAAISRDILKASRAELDEILLERLARETIRGASVAYLRMMTYVAAIAAFFGGAALQKFFDDEHKPEGTEAPPESTPPPIAPAVPPQRVVLPPPVPPRAVVLPPRRPREKRPEVPTGPTPGRASARLSITAPEGRNLIVNLTDSNFESLTSRGIWVVDFYADWCGPCQEIKPIFEKTFRSYRNQGIRFGRCKVNDAQGEEKVAIATAHGVRGIPAILFFKNGRETGRLVGADNTSEDFEREIRRAKGLPYGISDDPIDGLKLDEMF